MVGEGNNLKPKAIRILESYIKSIFTLVQIQYAEQPEGRVVRIPPPLQILNEHKIIFNFLVRFVNNILFICKIVIVWNVIEKF